MTFGPLEKTPLAHHCPWACNAIPFLGHGDGDTELDLQEKYLELNDGAKLHETEKIKWLNSPSAASSDSLSAPSSMSISPNSFPHNVEAASEVS